MASISVCMIVKNEEAVLARCLDSLGSIPDEIIIVDTGSTDGTKEIARRYTNKIFDFTWTDDFAAARNYSLQQASCEFVYTADADEVLDAENFARFMQLKEALMPELDIVEMGYSGQLAFDTISNFDTEYRPKLFRRLRPFLFVDPIHEVLRTEPVVFRSNVHILHLPTSDHSGRDLGIFAKLVRKGERFSSRLEMMYARELLLAGSLEDFKTARPYFAAQRDNPDCNSETARRAACILAQCAAMEANTAELLRVAAPELVGSPPAEICCALGDYYLAAHNENQAADWYSAALSGAVPELVAVAAGRRPLLGLAACFDACGDAATASHYRAEADAWTPEMLFSGHV